MNDAQTRRRSGQQAVDSAGIDTVDTVDTIDTLDTIDEDLDAMSILQLAHAHEATGPSASELAYSDAKPKQKAKPKAKKKKPTSSHDGGFTGFGAEYQPYSYTDPHMNHRKLDPKVERLGAQYVRIFVPLGAVTTGLLGAAGEDVDKKNVEHLEAAAANNPTDAKLKERLKSARKHYAQDVSYVTSFMKTLALAGKDTTINLTFSGSVGHDSRIDSLAQIIAHLTRQGYDKLQVTLENEPNGPDKGDGFRGRFNKAIKRHDRKAADAAAHEYVDAYHRLHDDLVHEQVRDDVSIVGGDMVGNNRAEFFETITREGLNNFVDGYSFHVYWGSGGKNHSYAETLHHLETIRKQAAHWAKGKPISITEFGKKRPPTKEENKHDPDGPANPVAKEKGIEPAFEQGLFALTAVNLGFAGVVKWDAFYGGEHHKGDGKGAPGTFYMIGGPGSGYATDETYRLMRMFTHATEPGWHVHGTNHGPGGAEARFKSEDGKQGAILAMSKSGKSISTNSLPHGHQLWITTWNANHKGELHTRHVAAGHRPETVHVPENGAVAISTRPPGH
jgi:hypothetical protein